MYTERRRTVRGRRRAPNWTFELICAASAVVAMAVATVATARAEEGGPAPEIDPRIDRTALVASEARHGDWERIYVASASMRRVVPVDVLRGGGSAPRPTLYLLDGVEAEETSGWLTKGRAAEFFSGKPVDVVITSGGVGSMYTDWQHYDAMLGLNRWETFLTDELPPVVEDYLDSTGRRAIAGVSMGAQGAMMLAQRHPGRYAAVAGLSGCYSTADDFGRAVTRMTVGSRGGDTVNLWGPPGSPEWAAHDSFLGADQLRGTVIHLSAGSGLPSPADLAAIAQAPNIFDAARMAGGGSTLEAGARTCTERFAARLSQLGIPVTVRLETTGMHTWPDFAAALGPAWHTLAGALRVPAD